MLLGDIATSSVMNQMFDVISGNHDTCFHGALFLCMGLYCVFLVRADRMCYRRSGWVRSGNIQRQANTYVLVIDFSLELLYCVLLGSWNRVA